MFEGKVDRTYRAVKYMGEAAKEGPPRFLACVAEWCSVIMEEGRSEEGVWF